MEFLALILRSLNAENGIFPQSTDFEERMIEMKVIIKNVLVLAALVLGLALGVFAQGEDPKKPPPPKPKPPIIKPAPKPTPKPSPDGDTQLASAKVGIKYDDQ